MYKVLPRSQNLDSLLEEFCYHNDAPFKKIPNFTIQTHSRDYFYSIAGTQMYEHTCKRGKGIISIKSIFNNVNNYSVYSFTTLTARSAPGGKFPSLAKKIFSVCVTYWKQEDFLESGELRTQE